MGDTIGMVLGANGAGGVGSRLFGQDFTWMTDGNRRYRLGLTAAAFGSMELEPGSGGTV